MADKRWARSLMATLMVSTLVLGTLLTGCSEPDAREQTRKIGDCVDYTVTADGRFAWAAMRPSGNESLDLRLVDIAEQRVVEEHSISVSNAHRSSLYTQGSGVYLGTALGENDDSAYAIYRLEAGHQPELVSDTLHTIKGHLTSYQWQGRLVFIGKNEQGQYASLFIQDEKIQLVNLESTFPELEEDIESIGAQHFYGKSAPPIGVWRYTHDMLHMSPWLDSSGKPIIVPDHYENAAVKLIQRYYANTRMLAFDWAKTGTRLVTINPADLAMHDKYLVTLDADTSGSSSMSSKKEPRRLDAPRFFNGSLLYLDRTTVLVAATKKPDPESEGLLYRYDTASNELESLSPDLLGKVFKNTHSLSPLAWRAGDIAFLKESSSNDAVSSVVMNLKDGTGQALSAELFEGIVPSGTTETKRPADTSKTTNTGEAEESLPWPWFIALAGVALAIAAVARAVLRRGRQAPAGLTTTPSDAQTVRLDATVTRAYTTGEVANWGHQRYSVDLAFDHDGKPCKGSSTILVGPGQTLVEGDEVRIDYRPGDRTITVLDQGISRKRGQLR